MFFFFFFFNGVLSGLYSVVFRVFQCFSVIVFLHFGVFFCGFLCCLGVFSIMV